MEYKPETGGYVFRSMCSSNGTNRVLDIVKVNGYVGDNVQIYTNVDTIAQEWLIFQTGSSSTTFTIMPRTCLALFLYAHETQNGTSDGRGWSSPGNVSLVIGGLSYSTWHFYREDGSIVSATAAQSSYSGERYFNNLGSGKYLKGSTSTLTALSGKVASLGNSIKWNVTFLGGNEYAIQPYGEYSKYLSGGSSTTSGTVSLLDLKNYDSIPDRCRWRFSIGSNGVKITNVYSGRVLYSNGSTVKTVTASSSDAASTYAAWRLPLTSSYGAGTGFSSQELSEFTMSSFSLSVVDNERKKPQISTAPSVAWASASDFSYDIDDPSIVTVDQNGYFTGRGSSGGITYVTATHKPTGISSQFGIVVSGPEDIKYLRMTRDTHDEYTLCVAELFNGEKYWYQLDDDGNSSDVLCISKSVRDQLDEIYADYTGWTGIFSENYRVFNAKRKLDQSLANGELYDVSKTSDEYYGLWLFFTLIETQYQEAILLELQLANLVTQWANIANQAIALSTNISLLVSSYSTLSAVEYASTIAASETFRQITQSEAVALGITDTALLSSGGRYTWIASELYVAKIYTVAMGYKYNQAYILKNGVLTEVARNTAGSIRPDFYNPAKNQIIEVKNYNITTSTGRSNLVNNIITQYNERVKVFPKGLTYEVQIDVRGQKYDQTILNDIESKILSKSNNAIVVKFITY